MPILGNGITCVITNGANDNSVAIWNGDFASAHSGLFVDSAVFEFKDGASGAVELPWPKKLAGNQAIELNGEGQSEGQTDANADDSGVAKPRAANDIAGEAPLVRTAAVAYGMREIVAVALLLGLDLIYVSDFIKKASARTLPAEDDSERAAAFGDTGSVNGATEDAELAYDDQGGSELALALSVSDGEFATSTAETNVDERPAFETGSSIASTSDGSPVSARATAVTADPASVDASSVINGTDGDDILYGTDGDDVMFGGAGNDIMFGGAGNDIMSGDAGNDVLDGGDGADLMAGGTGDDTYGVDDVADLVVEAADAGTDTIIIETASVETAAVETDRADATASAESDTDAPAGNDGSVAEAAPAEAGSDEDVDTSTPLVSFDLDDTRNVENLTVLGAADFAASGNELDNIIITGSGDDTLEGDAGADTLVANAGDDTLDGGLGGDTMAGGTGDDTYVVDNAADVVVEVADAGVDTIATTVADVTLGEYVENLTYTGTEDATLTGNSGDNTITGGDGDDYLVGDASPAVTEVAVVEPAPAPTAEGTTAEEALTVLLGTTAEAIILIEPEPEPTLIVGSRRNDTLVGSVGGGRDILLAGKGNDKLDGGGGDDELSGGSGSDTFIFRAGFGNDVITDFGNDDDVIYLIGHGFDSYDDIAGGIEQVGDDVVIHITAFDSISLQNFDKLNLSPYDSFIFA